MTTTPISSVRGSRQESSALAIRRRRPAGTGDGAVGERPGRVAAADGRPGRRRAPRRAASRAARRPRRAAITENCSATEMSRCDASAPIADPATAPIENAAWNCGITVRPMARSIRADSTFSGTLPSAIATPLRKMPTPEQRDRTDGRADAHEHVPDREHRRGQEQRGAAAEPLHHDARERHRQQRAQRADQEHQAELAGRQVEQVADGRDPGEPAGEDDAGEGEQTHEEPAGSTHGRGQPGAGGVTHGGSETVVGDLSRFTDRIDSIRRTQRGGRIDLRDARHSAGTLAAASNRFALQLDLQPPEHLLHRRSREVPPCPRPAPRWPTSQPRPASRCRPPPSRSRAPARSPPRPARRSSTPPRSWTTRARTRSASSCAAGARASWASSSATRSGARSATRCPSRCSTAWSARSARSTSASCSSRAPATRRGRRSTR